MGDKEHHVHFSGGSGLGFNNIVIQPQRHGHLEANVGFLQLHHRYHIEFSIPWNRCIHEDENRSIPPAIIVDNSNLNCSVIDFAQEKDDLKLKVQLLAYHTFLKELIQLKCCNTGTPLNVILNARALGKDKGTPMLRNGVRSIAVEDNEDDDDDDSE